MTTLQINRALSEGHVEEPGVLPKLDQLEQSSTVFAFDFGLDSLPEEPGILVLRGARQYGKSTWLQKMIKDTIDMFGAGTAFFLNGDEIISAADLRDEIRMLLPLYRTNAPVRRLFVDEITAINDWQKALKVLADQGEVQNVLIVTTGSQAADLRHGSERLPGRKGRLSRTSYLFTPIPFGEFASKAHGNLAPEDVVPAYILSGGSPVAGAELISTGRLPDFVIELVRDWIFGAFARSGRSRASLLGVIECIFRFAGSPVGQSKLAREAGLANNTIAAEYIDTFADLLCVGISHPWDSNAGRGNRRRPSKYHFTNTLAGTAWHPLHPRSPADFHAMPDEAQAAMLEWTVAQELFRRAAIRGDDVPELIPHWASREHEIDFVESPSSFVEVKLGRTSPLEFAWFPKTFPNVRRLTVVSESRYETDQIVGVTIGDFLLGRITAFT